MKANRFIRQIAADERAVSEVIGAVLVFGILIAVLALVQTQAVPATNEEVEFQHSQQVQADMAELNEAISLTAAQGRSQSPTMKLGMTYPARLFFFNPSPVYGQLRTKETGTIEFKNVVPTGNTNLLYQKGAGPYQYSSRPIEYRAGYHRFDNEPTIFREVGVFYERYPAGTRVQSGAFINGKQITLITVNGTLERNRLSAATIETVPLSAPARTVAVTNASGKNIQITVPTELSENNWKKLMESQLVANGGFVVSWTYTSGSPYNHVTVTLRQGESYRLRMARIGLGTKLHEPSPAYITSISGDPVSVIDNGLLQVTLEVRDKFNNPVSGKIVNMSITGSGAQGEFLSTGSDVANVTTAADGRVTVTYVPPNVETAKQIDIEARADTQPFDPSNRNHTNVDIKVVNTGGPIGLPPFTPPLNFDVDDRSDFTQGCVPVNNGPCVNVSGDAAYSVDWEINDSTNDGPNSELDTVELRLIDDDSKRIVDFAKYDVSGEQVSGNTLLVNESGANQEYIVKIIYADEGGFVRQEECNADLATGGPGDPSGCDEL